MRSSIYNNSSKLDPQLGSFTNKKRMIVAQRNHGAEVKVNLESENTVMRSKGLNAELTKAEKQTDNGCSDKSDRTIPGKIQVPCIKKVANKIGNSYKIVVAILQTRTNSV